MALKQMSDIFGFEQLLFFDRTHYCFQLLEWKTDTWFDLMNITGTDIISVPEVSGKSDLNKAQSLNLATLEVFTPLASMEIKSNKQKNSKQSSENIFSSNEGHFHSSLYRNARLKYSKNPHIRTISFKNLPLEKVKNSTTCKNNEKLAQF